MFESSIVKLLRADNMLVSKLSTYNSMPTIFSNQAPEGTQFPCIVFYIHRTQSDDACLDGFVLMVDYYSYGVSDVNANIAVERIEFLLDRAHLEHDRYDTIRVFFFSGTTVPDPDPRMYHYNLQFNARAGRKKWMQQL